MEDGGLVYKALNPDDMIPLGDDDALLRIVRPYTLQMIMAASEETGGLVGLSGLVGTDRATQALLEQAAQRVVQINEVTRQAIREMLAAGLSRGLSDFEIARGVTERRDEGGNIVREAFRGLREVVEETYEHRADTIARTEMALASQEAAEDRYGVAGVMEVDVMDGEGCGWTEHDDPDVADGSRRTLGESREHPLSHPNCVRVFLPVLP